MEEIPAVMGAADSASRAAAPEGADASRAKGLDCVTPLPPETGSASGARKRFPDQGTNGFDRSLFRANLRLTPTQRIEQLQRAIVLYLEVRRAGRVARLSRNSQPPR